MKLIDTHCHINDPNAFTDVRATLNEAAQAGVYRCFVIGMESVTFASALKLADEHDEVYAVLGYHPNRTANFNLSWIEELRPHLAHKKVLAVGEIGLDYHWDYASKDDQMAALTAQLDLAEQVDKPAVFHSREANHDLLAVLESRPTRPYLVHCFSGDKDDAARLNMLGAYIGVDGPITYPKSTELRDILATYPKDRVVIETDSPYMAPVPYRGKPNQPAYVAYVCEALARVWGVSKEEAARITTENALRFFRLSESAVT